MFDNGHVWLEYKAFNYENRNLWSIDNRRQTFDSTQSDKGRSM